MPSPTLIRSVLRATKAGRSHKLSWSGITTSSTTDIHAKFIAFRADAPWTKVCSCVKKRLQAHVGYSIIKIKQDEYGAVTRFAVEWFPFFDRGYYEKRFG